MCKGLKKIKFICFVLNYLCIFVPTKQSNINLIYKKMNILKEASKRVQKDMDKLTINELIKMDTYTYKNDLMNFYIKEIQKEIKNKFFKKN